MCRKITVLATIKSIYVELYVFVEMQLCHYNTTYVSENVIKKTVIFWFFSQMQQLEFVRMRKISQGHQNCCYNYNYDICTQYYETKFHKMIFIYCNEMMATYIESFLFQSRKWHHTSNFGAECTKCFLTCWGIIGSSSIQRYKMRQ